MTDCAHLTTWHYEGGDAVTIPCPECGDGFAASPAFAAHRRAIDREIDRLAVRDEAKREYEAIFREPTKTLAVAGAASDIEASSDAPEWLIEPILPSDGFVLLTAQAKTGKTTFTVAALVALLEGRDFLGWKTMEGGYPRQALYVNLDMPPRLFRYYAAPFEPSDRLLVLHGASGQYDVTDTSFTDAMRDLCTANDVGIVAIDVWGSLYSGDESDNSEARRAIGCLAQLRQACELDAIILLHHAGWSGANRARGASSIEGAVDVLWRLDQAGANRSRFQVDRSRIESVQKTEIVYDPRSRTITRGGVGVPGSTEHEKSQAHREAVAKQRKASLAAILHEPGMGAKALHREVGGNAAQHREAVEQLVADGFVRVETEGGVSKHFPTHKASEREALHEG